MPRPPTTKVKSERHAELGRASIAGRLRDERGHFLPRAGAPTPPPAAPAEPPPEVEPAADPTPARSRARLPWQRA